MVNTPNTDRLKKATGDEPIVTAQQRLGNGQGFPQAQDTKGTELVV